MLTLSLFVFLLLHHTTLHAFAQSPGPTIAPTPTPTFKLPVERYCRVLPHTRTYYPPPNVCNGTQGFDSNATLEDAKNIAHMYSPVVYFHPLETSFLANGKKWIEQYGPNATLILSSQGQNITYGPVTEDMLYQMGRNASFTANANQYYWYFPDNFTDSYRTGDPFNDNNQSTASVYFSVMDYEEDPNIWIINYYYYFPYQGCSNQWTIEVEQNANRSTNALLEVCNIDVHDSDVENIAVMVCKNTNGMVMPLTIRYMQHDKPTTFRDCSVHGQCNFVPQGLDGLDSPYHPLAFSALNSHAMYDLPATNYIYAGVPIPFIANFLGVFMTDRTSSGNSLTSYRFVPTKENNLYLPPFDELNPGQNPDTYWLGFVGHLGLADGEQRSISSYTCLNNVTGLEYVDCPTDQAFLNIVLNFYGFNMTTPPNLGPLQTYKLMLPLTAEPAPTGPYTKLYSQKWVPQQDLDLFDYLESKNESWTIPLIELFLCAYLETGRGVPVVEYVKPVSVNILNTLIGFILLTLILSIIYFIAHGIPLNITAFRQFQYMDWTAISGSLERTNSDKEDSQRIKKTKKAIRLLLLDTSLVIIWLIASAVGFGLWVNSLPGFFDLLTKYLDVADWDTIEIIIIAAVSVGYALFLVVSIFHIFLGFKSSRGLMQDKLEPLQSRFVRLGKKKVTYLRWAAATTIFFGLLYVFLFFISILVAIVAASIIQIFVPLCNEIGTVTEGVCINFNILGGSEICSDEIVLFCNSFTFPYYSVLWGGILLFLAGVFGFLTTISIYWHFRYYIDINIYLHTDSPANISQSSFIMAENGDIVASPDFESKMPNAASSAHQGDALNDAGKTVSFADKKASDADEVPETTDTAPNGDVVETAGTASGHQKPQETIPESLK